MLPPETFLQVDDGHKNGFSNTYYCNIWATEIPNIVKEIALHLAKDIIWCGFTANFTSGLFFLEEQCVAWLSNAPELQLTMNPR